MKATQALALATMIGCFDQAFHLMAGACVRCVKNRIGSVVVIFLRNDRLRQLRDLRLRIFVFFCFRNFLAFIAFLVHFLFCLRIFSYARPCVRCVRLNGNRA